MESLNHWQSLLEKGNTCFAANQLLQAEFYYKEAVEFLEKAWRNDLTNVELLMAWICAAHNLSTLFEKQRDFDVSLQYLLLPHHRLLTIISDPECQEDIQLIAISAIKLTFKPIQAFSKRHPVCNECAQAITAFGEALNDQQPQLH
ncbi:hypothetical protein [Thalassotalea fusca]